VIASGAGPGSVGVGNRTGVPTCTPQTASESRGFPDGGKCSTMRAAQSQEGLMPEVVFYALGGRSIEQKRALIKDFTDAVVKNYKVDPGAVTITIVESAKEDKAKGGVLFSDMGAAKT
jgi:4-oxalocrotonate tautomerase